jgi:hypothetical protein
MNTGRALFVSMLAGAVLLGCAKPRQLGGSIAVSDAGLSGRIAAFCRLQDPSAAQSGSAECLGEPLE